MTDLWFVRSFLTENGERVYLDEGPWSRELAELADIGRDASIPRGLGLVDGQTYNSEDGVLLWRDDVLAARAASPDPAGLDYPELEPSDYPRRQFTKEPQP